MSKVVPFPREPAIRKWVPREFDPDEVSPVPEAELRIREARARVFHRLCADMITLVALYQEEMTAGRCSEAADIRQKALCLLRESGG